MRYNLILFLLAIMSFADAQQLTLPLNHDVNNLYGKEVYRKDAKVFTSIRPYLESDVTPYFDPDTVWPFAKQPYPDLPEGRSFMKGIRRGWYNLLNDDIIPIRKGKFYIGINPLFDLSLGREMDEGKWTSQNTRGAEIKGNIGPKFSFHSRFWENQARLPNYLDELAREKRIIPGQGRPRSFAGGKAFDYAYAEGYISFTPNEVFNLQFGHGKNFLGDGYRSLLLSDNSMNYPYLKMSVKFWNIKYMVMYTEFQDLDFSERNFVFGFPKKHGTFHYLSWDVSQRFQFSLFESIVWQAHDDSTGQFRGFELQYLNPVIFLRPTEFALGSPDNALLGFNASFKATDRYTLYTQFIMDDINFGELKTGSGFYQNKIGWQLGFKGFDLFGLENLFFQNEINLVRPYTYSHKNTRQNYAHYNQALAHPLGANFIENVTIVSYRWKRLHAKWKLVIARTGLDREGAGEHNGQDIFKSDFVIDQYPRSFGNSIGQGVKATYLHNELTLQYVVNPKLNMSFELRAASRSLNSNIGDQQTTWLSFGFKTGLQSFYFDF